MRNAAVRMTDQDEFPAVYSLGGCSPAVPAAASTAATIFDHNRPFANPANGNCRRARLSHFATQVCLHFTRTLADPSARLEVKMARYSFLVGLFHPLLHAGLSRRLRSLTLAAQLPAAARTDLA